MNAPLKPMPIRRLRAKLVTAERNLVKQREITADLRARLSKNFQLNKALKAELTTLKWNLKNP